MILFFNSRFFLLFYLFMKYKKNIFKMNIKIEIFLIIINKTFEYKVKLFFFLFFLFYFFIIN